MNTIPWCWLETRLKGSNNMHFDYMATGQDNVVLLFLKKIKNKLQRLIIKTGQNDLGQNDPPHLGQIDVFHGLKHP